MISSATAEGGSRKAQAGDLSETVRQTGRQRRQQAIVVSYGRGVHCAGDRSRDAGMFPCDSIPGAHFDKKVRRHEADVAPEVSRLRVGLVIEESAVGRVSDGRIAAGAVPGASVQIESVRIGARYGAQSDPVAHAPARRVPLKYGYDCLDVILRPAQPADQQDAMPARLYRVGADMNESGHLRVLPSYAAGVIGPGRAGRCPNRVDSIQEQLMLCCHCVKLRLRL